MSLERFTDDIDIKYSEREFPFIKDRLINFAKSYFPDTYNDFDETSPGNMFIEMAAYVGDILSFYTDTQIQETFLQHAKEKENLYTLAYMFGYRPKPTTISEVDLEISQTVEAIGPNYEPNFEQALALNENFSARATSSGNPLFLVDKTIDFSFSSSFDPTNIRVASVDGSGNPEEYTLSKSVRAFSGEINTITREFTDPQKFSTISIQDEDIIGVLDIVDSDGNEWREVPFLGQDTVFTEDFNSGQDGFQVNKTLTVKKVPKRFVTRFTSTGTLEVQFGAGISPQSGSDSSIVPDPSNVVSPYDSIGDLQKAYNPNNFMYTQAYGLAPSNTTLTIRYLTGGGISANAPANSITNIENLSVATTGLTFTNGAAVETSLQVNNPRPASGGKGGESTVELRQNISKSFSEQLRVVTPQDFEIRALSMPARFGSVAKVYVTKEPNLNSNVAPGGDPYDISMYVLAYDGQGKLEGASQTLIRNLRKYLSEYILVGTTVDIRPAFIVNIGIEYEVLTLPNFSGRNVLLDINRKLAEYFSINRWTVNQPIILSKLFTFIDRVKGVQTVKNVKIVNKAGGEYSSTAYDTVGATRNGIVYPPYDPAIFELKFPTKDIKGKITPF